MLFSFIESQSNSKSSLSLAVVVASVRLISDCKYRLLISFEFVVSIRMPNKMPARKITIVIIRASQNTCFLLFSILILPGVVAAEEFVEGYN